MTVHLVTFSDSNMMRAAGLCLDSGMTHGADSSRLYTKDEIADWPIVKANPTVFRQPENPKRAYAWFAFKPVIILDAIKDLNDGGYLIYSDAGVEFIDNQKFIIDRMDQDVFLFGNMWEHAHWCKRDVVEAIWPSNRVETRIMLSSMPIEERVHHDYESAYNLATWARFGKQCQASVIFLRVSDYSRKFVKEWLDWCLSGARLGAALTFGRDNPAHQDDRATWSEFRYLIDDSPSVFPNHPEFQEHRWDQAILTTLAYREGIRLHWWPAVYNRFVPGGPVFTYEKGKYKDNYPPLYHHHRRRDHEWSNENE